LVGSATLVDHDDLPVEGEHVKMIERKPTIIPGFDWGNVQNWNIYLRRNFGGTKKESIEPSLESSQKKTQFGANSNEASNSSFASKCG
jgi:hypothetical protein